MDLITHSHKHVWMYPCIVSTPRIAWKRDARTMVRFITGWSERRMDVILWFVCSSRLCDFSRHPLLVVTCARVTSVHFVTLSWKCHVSAEVGKIAGRLRHGAEGSLRQQGCPDPFLPPPPKVSSPISLSFTSPPSLRFVPPCPCLARASVSLRHSCVTDLLFSPRFWEIFAILTFLGSFQRTSERMTVIRDIVRSSRSSGDSGDARSCPRRDREGGQTYL